MLRIVKGIYSHKWCLHSILPLAPRAKQPALHFQKYITYTYTQKKASCPVNAARNTELGCGTRPVSIGSRRRRAECSEHFGVISVFVHGRFAWGEGGWWRETLRRLNVIRNCSKRYRTLREPTVPICIDLFKKPCLKMKTELNN